MLGQAHEVPARRAARDESAIKGGWASQEKTEGNVQTHYRVQGQREHSQGGYACKAGRNPNQAMGGSGLRDPRCGEGLVAHGPWPLGLEAWLRTRGIQGKCL